MKKKKWVPTPAEQDAFQRITGFRPKVRAAKMAPRVRTGFPTSARGEVMWFALQMENKLRKNDWKESCDNLSTLYEHLLEEVNELENALISNRDPSRIIEEAADVANIAMMIANIARHG